MKRILIDELQEYADFCDKIEQIRDEKHSLAEEARLFIPRASSDELPLAEEIYQERLADYKKYVEANKEDLVFAHAFFEMGNFTIMPLPPKPTNIVPLRSVK